MSTIAQNVIDGFKRDVTAVCELNASLIAELEAELDAVSWGLSESYSEFTDELSGDLGASAANECAPGADQDEAISACESFVSNEVASESMSLVSACIAFYGPDKGRQIIGKMVSESPLRSSLDVSL